MKTATIKAHCRSNISLGKSAGQMEITGKVVSLKVGETLQTFLTHDGFLSHYASGKRVGVMPLPAQPDHPDDILQMGAEMVIEELILEHGIDRVLVTLSSTETLNEEPT